MNIIFLHLSDLHIRNEKDISDTHLQKIVDALKCYKFNITNIIIIISGDLTNEGTKTQFSNVVKIIGTIIKKIKETFINCVCNVLPVPGNHDVNHNDTPLSTEVLKTGGYNSAESSEHQKLEQFYVFSKFNKCFVNNEIYTFKRLIEINKFKIQANLINNAIYSTTDEYKGLLYIPNENIEDLSISDADFTITIMHHAPDFYRDDIKNALEEKTIGKSSVLFCGHEHHNGYRRTSYEGSNEVIVQMGGCLCNNGDWSSSSFKVGILNTETKEYRHQKFDWNITSKQYEHDEASASLIATKTVNLPILKEFKDTIFDEDFQKGYFVFPVIKQNSRKMG